MESDTMTLYPFLFAAACFIYLALAIFVLAKKPDSTRNRLIALILLGFAVWSFQDVFRFDPRLPQDIVRTFVNIGAFGWCSFASIALWFALAFVGKRSARLTSVIHALLTFASMFLVYKQWTGGLVADFIRQPWGWAGIWAPSLWTDLYDVYHLVIIGTTLYLIFRVAQTTESALLKRQSIVFAASGTCSLAIGFVLNRLLPRLGIYSVPQIASLARQAKSKIWIAKEDTKVNAASILDILTLACEKSTEIDISIEDKTDLNILEEIEKLVKRGFEE